MAASTKTQIGRRDRPARQNEAPSDASKTRILAAAVRAFSTDGFDGTSIGEICNAAGVTRPTLYYFYGSKEGLFRAAILAVAELEASLISELAGSPSFEVGCRRFARYIFRFAAQNPDVVRLALSMTKLPSRRECELTNNLAESRGRVIDRITGAAAAALPPQHRRVAHLFALIFVGAIDNALTSNLTSGKPAMTSKFADSVTSAVFSGWK